MSLPSSAFLDTSILAGQQYNFSSTALASFVPVATRHSLALLLPDPTEREIRRQIEERSREALSALEEARRRAPFLAKWQHFPKKVSDSLASWEVRQVAFREWTAFLAQFKVTELGYDAIDISEVMRWYDQVSPPFRDGKKRKEFPDAFAVAILAAHAAKTNSVIAVVSEDSDFKLACDRYPLLLYFKSLPALTELLLADPAKIDTLRNAVLADVAALDESIWSAAAELSVVHSRSDYDVEDSNVTSVDVTDVRVVAIGSGECTLAFEADLETENRLKWREWDDDQDEYTTEKEWIIESSFISGSAKVSLDLSDSKIKDVLLLSLDQEFLEVSENPRRRW